MDMGISCARSHQASDGQDALNDPGQRQLSPLRNRGQHLLAVTKVYVCQLHRTTQHHSTAKQELLLNQPRKSAVLKGAYSSEKRLEQWDDLILVS